MFTSHLVSDKGLNPEHQPIVFSSSASPGSYSANKEHTVIPKSFQELKPCQPSKVCHCKWEVLRCHWNFHEILKTEATMTLWLVQRPLGNPSSFWHSFGVYK